MPPVRKRHTRSSLITNEQNQQNTSNPKGSIQENENVIGKRPRTKRSLTKKTQSLNEQNAGLPSDEIISIPPTDQSTYATLQPVPLDVCDNLENASSLQHSPPALIINETEEAISSQLHYSNYTANNLLNENDEPSDISYENNKTKKKLLNDVTNNYSLRDYSINMNEELICTNNFRANTNRTPNVDRNMFNNFSQVPEQSIVVSVEKSPRSSSQQNNYSCRTSTPLGIARRQQVDGVVGETYSDSFSIDQIPPGTYEVLSRFPEFRRLVKSFNNEKQKCQTWINDYARLQRRYKQLEENSFPRPPASALNYLTDLVTHIQRSGGHDDPRSDQQLAEDLGVNEVMLRSLKDSTPQKTALNLFNRLYPGHITKMKLGTIDYLDSTKPGLLESILVFSQRAVPGVSYRMRDLRDALSNSIRVARYHIRRANLNVCGAMNSMEPRGTNQVSSRQDKTCIEHQNMSASGSNMEIDELM